MDKLTPFVVKVVWIPPHQRNAQPYISRGEKLTEKATLFISNMLYICFVTINYIKNYSNWLWTKGERSYQTLQLWHYRAHGQLKLDLNVWNEIWNLILQLITIYINTSASLQQNCTSNRGVALYRYWQKAMIFKKKKKIKYWYCVSD